MSAPIDSRTLPLLERACERLLAVAPTAFIDPQRASQLRCLLLASDFALDTLCRQPELLAALDAPAALPPELPVDAEADWPRRLRRWRAAESTRLIWRDVLGRDGVEQTLAGSSWIAEQALQTAVNAVEALLASRHGRVPDGAGGAQSLVVFGLGKLGGGELNFSSDVDLVYAYARGGHSDGARSLDAESWFVRAGQRLGQLLGDVTADGFCHRVDLRLRPFGSAGRLALSFAAMEQYFQREGRDWERYAWIKARPVAGDIAAGEQLLSILRPFVYRRYLDYTALDGLREMKALIAAEVQKRELADHLKLGPGGIREVEFLVQALQLIRGGREPALRQRALLPALQALAEAGHLPEATAQRLATAYRFLRRLENRVQMLADQQVHELPADAAALSRIACSLGHVDAAALRVALDAERAVVSEEFDRLLEARRQRQAPSALNKYWRALPDGGEREVLRDAGFADAESADALLRDFAQGPGVRTLSARGRSRLDHVLPLLLAAAAKSSAPAMALKRGLALLQAVLRRTSYLALLEEQPAALARLVDVTARSALLAERLAAHPLLLDELLDSRVAALPDEQEIVAAVAALSLPANDLEAALQQLAEYRQSGAFRIALATLAQRQPAQASARQLAALAEAVLVSCLRLVRADLEAAHGCIDGAGFAVIGYGSIGGREFGFGSDLDLVFLHDASPEAMSDGARPLDASRYFARLAQKLVSLLGTVTGAGKLYEVDVRLRPDGAKGLLVSTVASFGDYQRERAWTWERQALVRARALAGDAAVCASFESIRRDTLCQARDVAALRDDVMAMRRRMRGELDRGDAARFDLKQGEGGLVDLEFLLQAEVLQRAAAEPALCQPRDTPGLLAALGCATELAAAHALLLARGLDCTLDQRPRLVAHDESLEDARAVVREACRRAGLDFR